MTAWRSDLLDFLATASEHLGWWTAQEAVLDNWNGARESPTEESTE